MRDTDNPSLGNCANCGDAIVYSPRNRNWTHVDGRGTACHPGKPTGTYLDSPGMRDAHLRSARGGE